MVCLRKILHHLVHLAADYLVALDHEHLCVHHSVKRLVPRFRRMNRSYMRAEVAHQAIDMIPTTDPLSIHNRARTPPPPERPAFQQNTPPPFPSGPPVNGFGLMGQPAMPPFSPAPPQNPFMPPPPFGHPPFMFPNQYGKLIVDLYSG
ncbi:hypothetical protein ANCDUO_17607 [Ancylostoma duodenale]|uniref:Uncharacterized protein n=1 Tax=Ancylostoma duodenale TaxID=51022 RepID=A0A0C2CR60_9BILA|nr:hypothetical protein ANCDUO_17607 [Ancylostoma duodenale]